MQTISVINFFMCKRKVAIFPAKKYNLSFQLVISCNFLFFLTKEVRFEEEDSVTLAVRKFGVFETFGV